MAIIVRPATTEDFAVAGRICVQAYRADGQLGEHGYETELADVAGRAAHGEVLVAVDEDTGEVLGCVTFVLPGSAYAELSRDGEAEFRMLAVAPEAQGRGAGEALARACLDRAEQAGASAVVICTRDFAHTAQRLYARLGFQRLPERDWEPYPGVKLLALRRELPVRSVA
ncbi:MAG TPA: GNAT family N-acetyltransferase [Micromonosporaceae bacterium]